MPEKKDNILVETISLITEAASIHLKDGADAAIALVKKKVAPSIARYFLGLFLLFIITFIPSIVLICYGVAYDSNWTKFAGGMWRLFCTIPLAIYAAPLALIFETLTRGAKGSGERYVQAIGATFIAELVFNLIIVMVPIKNRPDLIPALILCSLILGAISAYVFQLQAIRIIGIATLIILAYLIVSFYKAPFVPSNETIPYHPPAKNTAPQPVLPAPAPVQKTYIPTPAPAQEPTPVKPTVITIKFCPNKYDSTNQGWQKKVDLDVGYYLIRASGTVGFGSSEYNGGPVKLHWLSPEGMSAKPVYQKELPFSDKNLCSLIGRLGPVGIFFIGNEIRVHVSVPASLWLNVNHLQSQAGYGDPANVFRYNQGEWTVEIKKVG